MRFFWLVGVPILVVAIIVVRVCNVWASFKCDIGEKCVLLYLNQNVFV